MDKPKLYISGRISTGAVERMDIDRNKDYFFQCEKWLHGEGFSTYNPAADNRNVGQPWHFCMKNDLHGLLTCDGIAMVPGWDDVMLGISRGAGNEYRIARFLKYPVHDATNGDLIPDTLLQEWDALVGLDRPFGAVTPTSKVVQPEVNTESVAEEAARLVHGARQETYGHPYDNWTRTARIIGAILDIDVSPEEAALVMIGVKLARELNKSKRDNLVDIAGYAEVAHMIVTEEAKRAAYDMTSDE